MSYSIGSIKLPPITGDGLSGLFDSKLFAIVATILSVVLIRLKNLICFAAAVDDVVVVDIDVVVAIDCVVAAIYVVASVNIIISSLLLLLLM